MPVRSSLQTVIPDAYPDAHALVEALEYGIRLAAGLTTSGMAQLVLDGPDGATEPLSVGIPEDSQDSSLAFEALHATVRASDDPVVCPCLPDDKRPVLSSTQAVVGYAGVPLRLSGNAQMDAQTVGTLCVWATEPEAFADAVQDDLNDLAGLIGAVLVSHRSLWRSPHRWTPDARTPDDEDTNGRAEAGAADVADALPSVPSFYMSQDGYHYLQLALDVANAGTFAYDVVQDKAYWDEQTRAIYGVEDAPPSTDHNRLEPLLHPDDRAHVNAAFEAALQSKDRYELRYRMRRPDGSIRHIRSGGLVERDADGAPVRVIGFNQDLTEHVVRERQLTSINQHISEGIYRSTPSDGLMYVNAAFVDMFGYDSADEMLSVESEDLYADPSERTRLEQMEQESGTIRDAEVLFRRKDGSTFWGLVSGTVVYDNTGTEMYYDGAVLDITDRKRQKEALEHHRNLLQQTERLAGAWKYDLETGEISWSDAVYALHELPVGMELDLDMVLQFYEHDAQPALEEAVEKVITEQQPYDLELPLTTAQGNRRWVRAVGAPVVREGCVVELAGAIQDITMRKRAKTQLRLQSDVLEHVARGAPLRDVLTNLIVSIEALRPDLIGSILFYDEENGCVSHGVAPSLPQAYNEAIDEVPIGPHAGSCGTAMYHDKTVVAEDIATDPRWANYREVALAHNLRACWSTPIHDAGGAILGTFALYYEEPKAPTEAEKDLIEKAQALAGIAIERHRAAQALRESEERYRTLVERSHDAIYIYPNRKIVFANRRACELSGYSREALYALDPYDLIHPDDSAKLRAMIRDREEGESAPNRFDARILCADGSVRHAAFSVQAITYNDAYAVMGSVRDVTEKRATERALRHNKNALERERERLELALAGGDLGMWDLDVTTEETVYGERWASMLGYTLDELDFTLSTFESLTHPDDLTRVYAAIEQHVQGETPYFDAEIRMQAKDGSWRWILDRGKVLRWNPDGTPQRMVGTHMDITERKEAEQALMERERRVKALYDAVSTFSQAQSTTELAERIQSIVERTLRYPICAVRYKEGDHLVPVTVSDGCYSEMTTPRPVYTVDSTSMAAKAFRNQETLHVNDVRTLGDTSRFGAVRSVAYVPIGSCGTISVGSLSVDGIRPFDVHLLDILAHNAVGVLHRIEREDALRSARDEAEEMNELKSAFLANMTHEVRTPLTSILGFTELLSEMNLGDEGERFVGLIYRSGHRLLDTLNSVLDLSQLEAGMMEVHSEPVDVTQEAHEIVESFTGQALRQEVALTVETPPHATARVDRTAFQRVLSNLVSNAVKFTNDGGEVTVDISTTADRVRVAVSDTGVGIDPEFMPHLFDAFRQESSGNAREFEGSGLGLAITQRLVELMDGDIDVESEKNEGTTFTVDVPRV